MPDEDSGSLFKTRLLRNVLRWRLLALLVPTLAYFSQVAWRQRQDGWLAAIFLAVGVLVQAIVFGGIYWINQIAVRKTLMPRRDELAALLAALRDEVPAGNTQAAAE